MNSIKTCCASGRSPEAGIEEPAEEAWSPSITLGTPVTIPRIMSKISTCVSAFTAPRGAAIHAEIESFAAELIDVLGHCPAKSSN